MAVALAVAVALAFGLWPLAFGLWPLAFGLWPLDPLALGPSGPWTLWPLDPLALGPSGPWTPWPLHPLLLWPFRPFPLVLGFFFLTVLAREQAPIALFFSGPESWEGAGPK